MVGASIRDVSRVLGVSLACQPSCGGLYPSGLPGLPVVLQDVAVDVQVVAKHIFFGEYFLALLILSMGDTLASHMSLSRDLAVV